MNTDRTISYGIWNSEGTLTEMRPIVRGLSTNIWYNIIASYDGNFMRLYLNGKLLETYRYNGDIGKEEPRLIVSGFPWDPTDGGYFYGKVDEIRLSSVDRK